jgi:hypothetical protein
VKRLSLHVIGFILFKKKVFITMGHDMELKKENALQGMETTKDIASESVLNFSFERIRHETNFITQIFARYGAINTPQWVYFSSFYTLLVTAVCGQLGQSDSCAGDGEKMEAPQSVPTIQ